MKDTAEQSAALKMALKHNPVTDALRAEAEAFPLEADEAYFEVVEGRDTMAPGSWVAETLRGAVTSKEEARNVAIDWQSWQSTQSLSMGELLEWQHYFEELAERFDLTDEFRENGIL